MIRQYLDFLSDADFGTLEITEPVKFDAASFSTEKEPGRWGRDQRFMNEEISIFLYRGTYDRADNPLSLPDGTIVYELTMGFEHCLEYWNRYNFESNINYRVYSEEADREFVSELLMIRSDEATFIECKGVEATLAAKLKRNIGTKIDVYSTKDLDGNAATPLRTFSMLFNARPQRQLSQWKNTATLSQVFNSFGLDAAFINPFPELIAYEVQDSYNPSFLAVEGTVSNGGQFVVLPPASGSEFQNLLNQTREGSTVIKALYELSNIHISIKNFNLSVVTSGFLTNTQFRVAWGASYNSGQFEYHDFFEPSFGVSIVNADYDFTIPYVPSGGYIWFQIGVISQSTTSGTTYISTSEISYMADSLDITATSTAIDSVAKVSLYNEFLREIPRRINGQGTVQPRFDEGGEFYPQGVVNGYGMRQIEGKPFTVTYEDATKGIKEVACDYQANPTEVFNGKINDYYANREIGVFEQAPDADFDAVQDEQAKLNLFEYKYLIFEQSDDINGTLQSIHTDTQWKIPNDKAKNTKPVEIPFYRDFNTFEKLRRQSILTDKGTTSLPNDDNYGVIDMIELEPGTTRTYAARFVFQRNGDTLKVLNSTLANTEAAFNWTLIGLAIGDDFEFTTGGNIGIYTIVDIEPTVLTLNGSGAAFSGEEVASFTYTISGVDYQNRTNQGFDIIENIDSSENAANLQYGIRPNMKHWEPFLHTAAMNHEDRSITNQYYKSNGAIKTQFMGGQVYVGNGDIPVDTMQAPLITSKLYSGKLKMTFEQAYDFFKAYDTINDDGTIGGYFRTFDLNGNVKRFYLSKGTFVWSQGLLEYEAEEKYAPQTITIETLGISLIRITELSNEPIIVSNEWFRATGQRIMFFDVNSRPLTRLFRYDKITIDGQSFDNIENLCIALSEL